MRTYDFKSADSESTEELILFFICPFILMFKSLSSALFDNHQ